jgi:ribosomal protein S1
VVLSKKALDKHPIDEQISKIDLKAPIEGLVVNVLDYGCFVQLQPYGIQALLHRSKIPEGEILGKGDSITVFVDSVDQINRRVSLKMENNSVDQ